MLTQTVSISDYAFVYEFRDGKNPPPGTYPFQRWKGCTHVYAVFQGVEQVGAAKHLENSHGQMSITRLVKELKKMFNLELSTIPRVVLIGPEASYKDDNMYISNANVLQEVVPVQKCLQVVMKSIGKSKDTSRQRMFSDLGFTSSRCTA